MLKLEFSLERGSKDSHGAISLRKKRGMPMLSQRLPHGHLWILTDRILHTQVQDMHEPVKKSYMDQIFTRYALVA